MRKTFNFKFGLLIAIVMACIGMIACDQQKEAKQDLPTVSVRSEVIMIQPLTYSTENSIEKYEIKTYRSVYSTGREAAPGKLMKMEKQKAKFGSGTGRENISEVISPNTTKEIFLKFVNETGIHSGQTKDVDGKTIDYEYALYDSGRSSFSVKKDGTDMFFYYGDSNRTQALIQIILSRAGRLIR
jgi:hypothetical protein